MSNNSWKSQTDEFLNNPQRKSLQSKRSQQSGQGRIRRNSASAIALRHYEQMHAVIENLLEPVPMYKKERERQRLIKLMSDILAMNGNTSLTPSQMQELLGKMFQAGVFQSSNKLILDDGSSLEPHCDRFSQDYIDKGVIGRGAFGFVNKVISKLDQCSYAVKKIKLTNHHRASPKRILTEVLMMARLDHPNVVRYHTAWMEEEQPVPQWEEPKVVEIVSSEGANSVEKAELELLSEVDPSSYNPSFATSTVDPRPNVAAASKFFLPSNSSMEGSVENVATQATQESTSSLASDESASDESASGESASDESESDSSDGMRMKMELVELQAPRRARKMAERLKMIDSTQPLEQASTYIFIQMEICERTLTEYLVSRNHELPDPFLPHTLYNETFTFAAELMSAVNYLHENAVIHRDIKPSNIFLVATAQGHKLKLGDFGLACCDAFVPEPFAQLQRVMPTHSSEHHSKGVGTALYAAPEQMQTRNYGVAADVFSCGLVIIEMFGVFHTDMQRVSNLERARNGHIPEYVANISEELYNLLVTMLLRTADARPYANDVVRHITYLEHLTHNPESQGDRIRRLLEENIELREYVDRLEKRNHELEAKINKNMTSYETPW